ncbi:hypothetical protein [Lysobacter sp. HA18]
MSPFSPFSAKMPMTDVVPGPIGDKFKGSACAADELASRRRRGLITPSQHPIVFKMLARYNARLRLPVFFFFLPRFLS